MEKVCEVFQPTTFLPDVVRRRVSHLDDLCEKCENLINFPEIVGFRGRYTIFTVRVRSTREGGVFTFFVSSPGGGGRRERGEGDRPGSEESTPCPAPSPRQDQDRAPACPIPPGQDQDRVPLCPTATLSPQPGPEQGTYLPHPSGSTQPGPSLLHPSSKSQDQDRVTPLPRYVMPWTGYSADGMVPHPRSGWWGWWDRAA